MTTEENEHPEFSGEEKVYPNPIAKPIIRTAILLGIIILIVLSVLLRMYAVQFCVWLLDIPLRNIVNSFRYLGLGMVVAFSASFVGYLIEIFMGYSIKEIALTKAGVVFKRRRNSIVMQRIVDVKEGSRGRVLKLTGLTPKGKSVNRRVSQGDVGRKRWQEFKQDM